MSNIYDNDKIKSLLEGEVNKFLIKGPPGSGKTFTAVSEAFRRAYKGQTVVYFDLFESSARRGFQDRVKTNENDAVVFRDHIIYERMETVAELMDRIAYFKDLYKIDNPKFVIMDCIHYIVNMDRLEICEKVINKRYYMATDEHKKVTIDDTDLFNMPRPMYQVNSRHIHSILAGLQKIGLPLLVTLDEGYTKADQLKIDNMFDYVLEAKVVLCEGVPYNYIIHKARAVKDVRLKTPIQLEYDQDILGHMNQEE